MKKVILVTALMLGAVVIARGQEQVSSRLPWTPEKQREWHATLSQYDYIEVAKAYDEPTLNGVNREDD